jgi:hypothetical protein
VKDPRIETAIGLLQRALRADAAGDAEESRDLLIEALAVIAAMAVD